MKRTDKQNSYCPENAMRDFRSNNDIKQLAKKTGASHNIILDRLNPDRDAKLGYLDAIGHSHITGDDTLLLAWASDRGYGLFKKPQGAVGDEEILDIFLGIQSDQGDLAKTLHEARADGVINNDENQKLGAILNTIMNDIATLKAELQNQVREIK